MAGESRLSERESGFNTAKSKGIRLSAALSRARARQKGERKRSKGRKDMGGKEGSEWERGRKERMKEKEREKQHYREVCGSQSGMKGNCVGQRNRPSRQLGPRSEGLGEVMKLISSPVPSLGGTSLSGCLLSPPSSPSPPCHCGPSPSPTSHPPPLFPLPPPLYT